MLGIYLKRRGKELHVTGTTDPRLQLQTIVNFLFEVMVTTLTPATNDDSY